MLTRFDLWPAALVAGALALLLAGRDRLALGVLGVAVAAKVYPLVLLPLFAAWVWRRRGRREALIALGVAAGLVAVLVVPFLALARTASGRAACARRLGRSNSRRSAPARYSSCTTWRASA